jgi:hypothetical protein
MPDPQQATDTTWWGAVAAFLTAAGALLTAVVRKPTKSEIHSIRNRLNEHVLLDEKRLSALEAQGAETLRRLARIEDAQDATNDKLDRLIERHHG